MDVKLRGWIATKKRQPVRQCSTCPSREGKRFLLCPHPVLNGLADLSWEEVDLFLKPTEQVVEVSRLMVKQGATNEAVHDFLSHALWWLAEAQHRNLFVSSCWM